MAKTSFLELAITESAKNSNGPTCATCILLGSLKPADRADVEAAFAAPEVKTSTLARVLHVTFGDAAPTRSSVERHRRKDCRG
jgi:hypothetical protein